MQILIPFIICCYYLDKWLDDVLPQYILKSYPNISLPLSITIMFILTSYIFFFRPLLKEARGTKRIAFGKYKGQKWENLPSDYLEWVSHNFNDFNEASALRVLRKRQKEEKELESKIKLTVNENIDLHPYENTILGIIEREKYCWKCKKKTKVIALKFYTNMNDNEIYNYIPLVEYNIKNLHKNILNKLNEKYPFYKYAYSKTADEVTLSNCCIHCDSLQGNHFLHEEIDGTFYNSDKMKCNQFIVNNCGKLEFSNKAKK